MEIPLALPGTGGAVGMDYCVQFTAMEVDFHPTSAFNLPPELGSTQAAQSFAFRFQVCAGLGCPDQKGLDAVAGLISDTPLWEDTKLFERESKEPRPPPVAVPTAAVECFCLDLFTVAHFEWQEIDGVRKLGVVLDGVEIVDIQPKGLENSLECFITTLLRVAILPRMK